MVEESVSPILTLTMRALYQTSEGALLLREGTLRKLKQMTGEPPPPPRWQSCQRRAAVPMHALFASVLPAYSPGHSSCSPTATNRLAAPQQLPCAMRSPLPWQRSSADKYGARADCPDSAADIPKFLQAFRGHIDMKVGVLLGGWVGGAIDGSGLVRVAGGVVMGRDVRVRGHGGVRQGPQLGRHPADAAAAAPCAASSSM